MPNIYSVSSVTGREYRVPTDSKDPALHDVVSAPGASCSCSRPRVCWNCNVTGGGQQ